MKAALIFEDKEDGEVSVVLEFGPGTFEMSSEAHAFAVRAFRSVESFASKPIVIHGQPDEDGGKEQS